MIPFPIMVPVSVPVSRWKSLTESHKCVYDFISHVLCVCQIKARRRGREASESRRLVISVRETSKTDTHTDDYWGNGAFHITVIGMCSHLQRASASGVPGSQFKIINFVITRIIVWYWFNYKAGAAIILRILAKRIQQTATSRWLLPRDLKKMQISVSLNSGAVCSIVCCSCQINTNYGSNIPKIMSRGAQVLG